MFNVQYDTARGPCTYLYFNVETREEAEQWALACRERYEGKPYPNGKGFYDVSNVRVIEA